MNLSNRFGAGYWPPGFAASTLLILILTIHSYLADFYAPGGSDGRTALLRTILGWYLWAAMFPIVLQLGKKWRFEKGRKGHSLLVHFAAGTAFAIAHTIAQTFITDWLIQPNHNGETVPVVLQKQLISGFFWRFFVYQALLCFSLAFDSHRRAREIEIRTARMEHGILQSELELVQTRLDPELLFRSLKQLPVLMRKNFDQAESLIARLGSYLRMRLDHSAAGTTLTEEIESTRCYVDIENLHETRQTNLEFDLDKSVLECKVPAGILQAWVQDVLASSSACDNIHLRITARLSDSTLELTLVNPGTHTATTKMQGLIEQRSGGDTNSDGTAQRKVIEVRILQNAADCVTQIRIPLQTRPWILKESAALLYPDPSKDQPSAPKDLNPVPIQQENPVRKWLFIVAIFTGLAVYFTIQRWMIHSSRGTTMNWPQHLLDYSGWYIWALITPVVLRLSKECPLTRNHRGRFALVHTIAFLACWIGATLALEVVKWAANLAQYSLIEAVPLSFARSPIALDIFCYSTILAIESGIRYRQRYEAGSIKAAKLSSQLTRARLEALKTQIHPHFLYNSLNSLSELMQENPADAEKMIANLEMFLRMTIEQRDYQEVPFRTELEFLRCYLAIESVRYQERLQVRMNIDPLSMAVPVPALLLQPIVENAIRHGIALRKNQGCIDIQTKRSNGALTVTIRDNGPGIRKWDGMQFNSRVGLKNTRERLHELYGDNHRFDLLNAPEGGLIVNMEIPVNHGLAQIETNVSDL